VMAKKIARELFLSFPYIVLVQDKVLFTQIPASPSPLLFSWWRRVCPVGEVVQVIPIWRVWAVDVVVPVADPELLVEAGVVAAHVRDPPTVLVAHVEDHAVELEVSVEADGTVGAVEGERDVGHICPPTFLKQSASVLLKLRYCCFETIS